MKKIFTTIIAILLTINALALDVWDGSASPWTNGSGTSNDPYLIETAANLAYLAEKVNEGYQAQGMEVFKNVYFMMTDDLDLNNINWTPIGNVDYANSSLSGYCFAGIFDGWYHTISNLKIQTNASITGLFAGLYGEQGPPPSDRSGQIRHLSVVNGSITSTGFGAGGIVGAIAGEALVYQCSFSGTIQISNSDSFCGAGGIAAAAAQNSGIIECSYAGSITASNNGGFTTAAGAGGIVGIAMDNTSISKCYNTGNITSSAMLLSVAAGIVGATLQENNVEVFSCYNVGTVNAMTKGGIFGMVSPVNPTKDEVSINVTNCFYLNTCGGNTNYGTSKTSAEMQTEQFKNQIDMSSHSYVMDNGTNNGYPIHALTGFMIYEAKDVTAHSAILSANLHPGNASFSKAYFFYVDIDETDYHEVEIPTEGYVEVTIEDLLDETDYMFSMSLEYSDGGYVGFSPHWFTTEFDGIAEVSNSGISIYPNPTSDFIHIENIEPQLVTIYSLDGKMIKTVESTHVVDVRDLNEGLYLINISGVTKRIVIR